MHSCSNYISTHTSRKAPGGGRIKRLVPPCISGVGSLKLSVSQ